MESGLIIELVYQALRMAALLAGPTLLALLVVGLVWEFCKLLPL